MKMRINTRFVVGLLVAAWFGLAARAQADPLTFTMLYNFAAVAPGTPLYLEFQLVDGSGLGDGNNSVTLSGFDFGGGSVVGSAAITGDVTGDLSSPPIVLTDSSAAQNGTADLVQKFTTGSALQFDVSLTSAGDGNPPDDQFFIALLQDDAGSPTGLSYVPTTGPNGYEFFSLNITPTLDFAQVRNATYGSTSALLAIPTPTVTLAQAVPEPSTVSFALLLGVAGVGVFRRRGKR